MMTSSPATEAGIAAGIEALIAEARQHARRRRAIGIVVGLALVIVVGATAAIGWISRGAAGSEQRSAALGQAARTARLAGIIGACDPLDNPGSPPSQGGTVTVLRGQARSGPIMADGREFVLPATVVTMEQIKAGQRFSFQLVPGRYVLLARFHDGGHILLAIDRDGGVVQARYNQAGPAYQFLNVSIRSGPNPLQDIPSDCI